MTILNDESQRRCEKKLCFEYTSLFYLLWTKKLRAAL